MITVLYRIGSLESSAKLYGSFEEVLYRIGSLEKLYFDIDKH